MVGVRGGRINRAMRKKASNPGSRRVTSLTLPGDNMANEAKYSLPRVMTVKELSDYLRVHPLTIYKLLSRGELPLVPRAEHERSRRRPFQPELTRRDQQIASERISCAAASELSSVAA